MTNLGDYPQGAKDDTNAPFNEDIKHHKVSYTVSLCIDFEITKEVEVNTREEVIIESIKDDLKKMKDKLLPNTDVIVNDLNIDNNGI